MHPFPHSSQTHSRTRNIAITLLSRPWIIFVHSTLSEVPLPLVEEVVDVVEVVGEGQVVGDKQRWAATLTCL